ncbi:hypothetical protein QBC42DRAFT_207154 [Cladorrhinum samala]|uniref:Uncharacterized protein n=1 Tax=Cladorrhinum samala TaxID=585594 RepID=A0AAV9HLC9_9PEZI|nr:hypothetical protein QBC42DRAFT_207154 [Cladorrhinum samala]
MDDPIRLSKEEFRKIYEQSLTTWSRLHHTAIADPRLPPSHLDIFSAFSQHPAFPQDLELKNTKYTKYATGRSVWRSTNPECEHPLPPWNQQVQISVASKRPVSLSVRPTDAEPEIPWDSWFERGKDQNYLAVLILAWAYILSARWAEIMPQGHDASLVYTDSEAHRVESPDAPPLAPHYGNDRQQPSLTIDITDVDDPAEARFWAAVLAPDQGWKATISSGQDSDDAGPLFSPWSLRIMQQRPQGRWFILQTNPNIQSEAAALSPASFSDALEFLEKFCCRRGIADQSRAALAAVLLFPSLKDSGDHHLQLPALTSSARLDYPTFTSPCDFQHTYSQANPESLDRLIALSCHVQGIRPMLLSSFYDPEIECNAVSPWLQGALAAIDDVVVSQDDPLILGRMLMDRQPKIAPLWLGVTVLGLGPKLLVEATSYGMIPVNLDSAAWSGTVQSFIQLPVSDPPLVAGGLIARADECRFLFLARSERSNNDRVPVCQWKPFGRTPAEHADIDVRVHARRRQCRGHGLGYEGLTWDCVGGKKTTQQQQKQQLEQSESKPVFEYPTCGAPILSQRTCSLSQASINYKRLNYERDFLSRAATSIMFRWLRVDGFAANEQDIWKHEWFEADEDSDEEDDEEEDQSSSGGILKSNS